MATSPHPDPKIPPSSKILDITPLSPTAAKWITLSQISYVDPSGRQRTWEVASRKTRPRAAGVDAVAIGTIILSGSRPPSTLLVLQYRPPVDAITVEWPAGLVDEGESCEQAALRELREETGLVGATVLDVSPVVASDPGMTTANMRLVMVQVDLGDEDEDEDEDDGDVEGEEEEEEEEEREKGKGKVVWAEEKKRKKKKKEKELQLPAQQLDEGEFITRVVVPLDSLYYRLVEYSKREGFVVSAKLWHWAAGLHFAAQVAKRM